jgi:hypothetical protein
MPMFDPPPALDDLLMAIAAAAAGRLTLMLRAARRGLTLHFILWTLFWEVPVTAALGLMGWGLADWLSLQGGGAVVLIALLGRYGPERLEPLLETLVPQLRRTKP